MANIKFEIDGKIYDFAPESFVIDNEGNIILKSKPKAEKNPFERVKEGESFYYRLEKNDERPRRLSVVVFFFRFEIFYILVYNIYRK